MQHYIIYKFLYVCYILYILCYAGIKHFRNLCVLLHFLKGGTIVSSRDSSRNEAKKNVIHIQLRHIVIIGDANVIVMASQAVITCSQMFTIDEINGNAQ